jgi:hypothetical protein
MSEVSLESFARRGVQTPDSWMCVSFAGLFREWRARRFEPVALIETGFQGADDGKKEEAYI